MTGERTATNIRLPRSLLEAVDALALRQRRSRTGLIEVVLAAYVTRHNKTAPAGTGAATSTAALEAKKRP
jgi:predicted transcriptional regulator